MKYLHWVAYPVLALIIGFLGYSVVDQAVYLDDMKQASLDDRQAINDLLRYIAVNSDCDTTPQQLAAAMGEEYDLMQDAKGNPQIAHLAFRASFEGQRLSGIEVMNKGSSPVCSGAGSGR